MQTTNISACVDARPLLPFLQRYLHLQQVRAQPHAAQALLQTQGGSQQQAADALAGLLQDPDSIQREGLLAQEVGGNSRTLSLMPVVRRWVCGLGMFRPAECSLGLHPALTYATTITPLLLLPPLLPVLQLLLEVYEPLLVSRAKRAQSPHADYRELLSAARQGLLRAATRFDAGRVGSGVRGARLAALADRYIKNALRDVLTEVSGA